MTEKWIAFGMVWFSSPAELQQTECNILKQFLTQLNPVQKNYAHIKPKSH